jgi:hypothetical protein
MRIGMWNMLRKTVENTSLSAPPPEAPITVGLLRISANEAMPVEAMKAQTLTSCDTLPSQPNFVASNCAPSPWPSSG